MTSKDIDPFLLHPSPFANQDFEPGPQLKQMLFQEAKLLVVGAGGLGCEILKNLALMGFKNIDIVDMDTIELTNLNRQFLFRQQDIGKYKAEIAAKAVMKKIPNLKINYFTKSVQELLELDPTFYNEYSIIISGLDNIEARLFLNSIIYSLYEKEIVISLIDAGTEGPLGQCRVIIPYETPCFNCVVQQSPNMGQQVAMCTLGRPRTQEHVLFYVQEISFQTIYKQKFDIDDDSHVEKLFTEAVRFGQELGIEIQVRLGEVRGVLKRVVVAIASWNSVLAGVLVQETFKLLTGNRGNRGYYQWWGSESGVYLHSYGVGKLDNCKVCGQISENLI